MANDGTNQNFTTCHIRVNKHAFQPANRGDGDVVVKKKDEHFEISLRYKSLSDFLLTTCQFVGQYGRHDKEMDMDSREILRMWFDGRESRV
ncbi:hypothetical protein KI387_036450, partial [Taxus chinensis]